MFVKEISLKNFRNYKELDLCFHERMNLILGENAQGKTNLLESIYISSFGKSFRAGKDNEMIMFHMDFCNVKLLAYRDEEEKKVEIVISQEEKAVRVDSVKIKKISELMNHVLVVIFSPEDLKIVKEDPEKRRRFVDRELCQIKPSYFSNLASYKRVLLQRNAYLKEKSIKEEILDIWDERLISFGSALINQRKRFIERINEISKGIHKAITNGKEQLEVSYEANVDFCEDIDVLKEKFQVSLQKSLKKDMARGNTSVGPHRDDLKICINGVDIRRFGSQGQQRTAALSMKLAEIALIEEETGEKAILLLDDVLSELDFERQKFLIHSLSDVQLFITAAEISEAVKDALPEGYTFYVQKGEVMNRGG